MWTRLHTTAMQNRTLLLPPKNSSETWQGRGGSGEEDYEIKHSTVKQEVRAHSMAAIPPSPYWVGVRLLLKKPTFEFQIWLSTGFNKLTPSASLKPWQANSIEPG